MTAWAAILLVSLAFQSWRESGRPPFPGGVTAPPLRTLHLAINGDPQDDASGLIAREVLPEDSMGPPLAGQHHHQMVGPEVNTHIYRQQYWLICMLWYDSDMF